MAAVRGKGGGLEYATVVVAVCAAIISLGGAEALATYGFFVGTSIIAFLAVMRRHVDGLMVALVAVGICFPVLQAGIPFGYRLPPALIIFFVAMWFLRWRSKPLRIPIWWKFLLFLVGLGCLNLVRLYSESERPYAVAQVLWLVAELAVAWLALSWGTRGRSGPGPYVFSATAALGAAMLLVPLLLSSSTRIGIDQRMDPNGVALLAVQVVLAVVSLYLLWPNLKVAIIFGGGAAFSVTVLFRTASRQGIVIAMAALLVAVIASGHFGRRLKTAAIVLFAGVLALISVSPARMEYVQMRFDRAASEGSGISRIAHLRIATSIAVAHPLGLGSGGFRYEFRRYARSAEIAPGRSRPRPHGLLAMALADWGIPGGMLYLLAMGAMGLDVVRTAGDRGAVRKAAFIVLLLGSFAGTRVPLFALALAACPFTNKSRRPKMNRSARVTGPTSLVGWRDVGEET